MNSLVTGISRTLENGRFAVMESRAHIRQSIADIVTTPVGTRIMRPDYGSGVPRLIDRPVSKGWKLEVFAAAAEAIRRWEPRVRVERVGVEAVGPGRAELTVEYRLRDGSAGMADFTVGRAA